MDFPWWTWALVALVVVLVVVLVALVVQRRRRRGGVIVVGGEDRGRSPGQGPAAGVPPAPDREDGP